MRKIKEVLRLKWEIGLSNREIAVSCDIAHSTVGAYLRRARRAGLSWPLPETLSAEELCEDVEGAYSYTRFCELYRAWTGGLEMTPGEYDRIICQQSDACLPLRMMNWAAKAEGNVDGFINALRSYADENGPAERRDYPGAALHRRKEQ